MKKEIRCVECDKLLATVNITTINIVASTDLNYMQVQTTEIPVIVEIKCNKCKMKNSILA